MNFLCRTFTSWFGLGFSPIAPGTAGTAGAVPFALLLALFVPALPFLPGWSPGNLIAGLGLLWPAALAATRVEIMIGKHDPGEVVLDEVLGLWLTMAFLPTQYFFYAGSYLWAFFLFRLLDIWKPGWIDRMQSFPRGWGVMLDDVLAGILGGIGLALLTLWKPQWLMWGDLTALINQLFYAAGH